MHDANLRFLYRSHVEPIESMRGWIKRRGLGGSQHCQVFYNQSATKSCILKICPNILGQDSKDFEYEQSRVFGLIESYMHKIAWWSLDNFS
jgi:hypothetical protein